MSVQVTDNEKVAHYDSVTDIAFGPVFESAELANDYFEWILHNGPAAQGHPRDWSPALHARLRDRWFTERCDPETGLLKDEAEPCPHGCTDKATGEPLRVCGRHDHNGYLTKT